MAHARISTSGDCQQGPPPANPGRVISMNDGVWQLVRDGQTLASLVVTSGDFPWLHARMEPDAAFDEVRPMFDEELRLLDHLDDDPTSWEAACQRIRQALRLIAPDGRPVPEFLLHIDGTHAWWRWSGTPFT